MSFSVTFFGPRHYYWRAIKGRDRAWFYKPDRCSSGGVGFCVPCLHACFMWGRR